MRKTVGIDVINALIERDDYDYIWYCSHDADGAGAYIPAPCEHHDNQDCGPVMITPELRHHIHWTLATDN